MVLVVVLVHAVPAGDLEVRELGEIVPDDFKRLLEALVVDRVCLRHPNDGAVNDR